LSICCHDSILFTNIPAIYEIAISKKCIHNGNNTLCCIYINVNDNKYRFGYSTIICKLLRKKKADRKSTNMDCRQIFNIMARGTEDNGQGDDGILFIGKGGLKITRARAVPARPCPGPPNRHPWKPAVTACRGPAKNNTQAYESTGF